jgi:hypothetical protein
MAIDTDRLITVANELKTLDERREKLLAELHRIAQGISGGGLVTPRQASPARSGAPAKIAPLALSRGRTKGITADIVDFLKSGGGAYTAGEILAGLRLPKSKSRLSTISTTLVRLAKEGRAKKDKQRGYRAA